MPRPFDSIVREHGAVVMRVCRALLPSADADEAWSETFLSALQAYPRLRPDSDVRAWLVTIAHRKALDQLRAAKRRAVPSGELPHAATNDPQPDRLELAAALDRLAPKQRHAVVYRYLADLSYADVAALLGTSEDAARRNAADGIARLRREGVGR